METLRCGAGIVCACGLEEIAPACLPIVGTLATVWRSVSCGVVVPDRSAGGGVGLGVIFCIEAASFIFDFDLDPALCHGEAGEAGELDRN